MQKNKEQKRALRKSKKAKSNRYKISLLVKLFLDFVICQKGRKTNVFNIFNELKEKINLNIGKEVDTNGGKVSGDKSDKEKQ